MADLARALNTPVPATQPAPQQPASRTPAGPDPRGPDWAAADKEAGRVAKNKRDQERRKAQRAAHAKAVEAALAKKKKPKRKAKKKAAYRASDRAVMKQLPKLLDRKKKVRGRGRPPGSKNKPKAPLMDTVFPPQASRRAGLFRPGAAAALAAPGNNSLIAQISSVVLLLNAMPEHARKVVLDAVK